MTIESFLRRDVRTSRPSDNLATAAHAMWEADCGLLPVVDGEGHVLGTVSDRDLCMGTLFQGKRMDEIEVAKVMARDVTLLKLGSPIGEVLTRMREHQLRRLPVVDDDGVLQGIVTLADLARAWASGTVLGGRALKADDVARTLAAIVQGRGDEPETLMVVEFTPEDRAKKPAKKAGKKAGKRKAAKKAKRAKKAPTKAAKKQAERKQAAPEKGAEKRAKKKQSPPVAGGLFT